MTIAILLIIAGLLCFVSFILVRTMRSSDKFNPATRTLDDSFQLVNVLNRTWEYFDSHPKSNGLTEIHYSAREGGDIGCQISCRRGKSGQEEIMLSFCLPDNMPLPAEFQGQGGNPYELIIKGRDCREKAAVAVKEIMGITDSTKVPYQLAGSLGPILYSADSAGIDKNIGSVEFKVPRDSHDRRLSHIFELTWDFFSKNPVTRHFTEVHTAPACFQIFSEGTVEWPKYLLIIVLNPGTEVPEGFDPAEDVYQFTFEGKDADRKLEGFVYEKLGLNQDYKALYELTSQRGPEKFFEFCPEDDYL